MARSPRDEGAVEAVREEFRREDETVRDEREGANGGRSRVSRRASASQRTVTRRAPRISARTATTPGQRR
jgi:hypothetical protein